MVETSSLTSICLHLDPTFGEGSAWPQVQPHLIWRVRNGRSINCWNDSWIPGGSTLRDFTLRPLHGNEPHLRVCDLVDDEGHWDLARVADIIPSNLKDAIFHIKPPSQLDGDDRVAWDLSLDGAFSKSMAFESFLDPGLNYGGPTFKAIWHWSGPQRGCMHLWKMALGAFLTNEARHRRVMSPTMLCPVCGSLNETLMHVFKDCECAKDTWMATARGLLPVNFFDLDRDKWIEENLSASHRTKSLEWGVWFGLTNLMLWQARNEWVFQGVQHTAPQLFHRIHNQAMAVHNSYQTTSLQEVASVLHTPIRVASWNAPAEGWVKLNSDAAVTNHGYKVAVGGVVCGSYVGMAMGRV